MVLVFQSSLPWLDTTLEALKRFHNDTEIRYLFVENLPQKETLSTKLVNDFLATQNPSNFNLNIQNIPPAYPDGRAHESGLNKAFPLISSEWTLFLDADCIPCCDGWLDKLLQKQGDMIGFEPDSGIDDMSLPTLHPCMLLFKTKLAEFAPDCGFGRWLGCEGQTPDKANQWDVCRPFTYTIGMNPEFKQVRMKNIYSQTRGQGIVHFRLQDSLGSNATTFGIHIREGSRREARGVPGTNKSRWELLKQVPELSFYDVKRLETMGESYL